MSNIPFIDIEGGGGGSDIQLSGPPIPTPNYGILSLGGGPFDGVTAGHFAGNANGTVLAINVPLGYPGNVIDAQINGLPNNSFSVTLRQPGNGTGADVVVGTYGTVNGKFGSIQFGDGWGISLSGSLTNGVRIYNSPAGGIPLTVQGSASQTGDLQQWQSSTGTVLTSIAANGDLHLGVNGGNANVYDNGVPWFRDKDGTANGITLNTPGYLQAGNTGGTGNILILSTASTTGTIAVRGYPSQTADLMQFQDSAANIQLGVANAGTGVAPVWSLRIRALANAESMGRTHTLGAYSGKSIQVLDDLGATVGWIPLYA